MSMSLPETEMESPEYDRESAGLYDESEGQDYGEQSESDRRRARQRRIALAQRRQAQARARSMAGGRGTTAPARITPQQTATAIRNLDLETKVQDDAFRSALSASSKRMSRSEYAAVAGVAVNQFIESFDTPDNSLARAALRFSPLLLLSPQRRGTGFDSVIRDPRVIGGAAIAGITLIGDNRRRFTVARQLSVQAPSEIAVNDTDLFLADVLDLRGTPVDTPVTWESNDPATATIDPITGSVKGNKAGVVVITATADGIKRRVRLKVK
jgi:uncharacterized protein YjdB